MLARIKPDDLSSKMQDRVQRHYGGIVRAGNSSSLATTDLPNNGRGNAPDPSWEQALSQAMDRSTALMAAQADLSAREAELSRREAQVAQREKDLQQDRGRSLLDSLLAVPRQA